VTSQAVGPGWRLAGRYRLEDLLEEAARISTWKAVDEVLQRPVLVQTVPGDDPRSAELARAARAASVVTDTRFLRVLDVAEEGPTTYVVREWVPGHNLAAVLAAGPLPPDQAATLTREVADALSVAHRQGLAHLCLDPASVVVAPDGAVKVVGLATEAVVRERTVEDPAREDALGLGRLLYSALTGRWPGPSATTLPAAPVVDGRVASPRQVRPGIPRVLDETVDRALATPGRQHGSTLGSPAEVLAAVSSLGETARRGALRAIAHDAGTRDVPPPPGPPALIPDDGRPPVHAARVAEPLPVEHSAPGDRRAIRALAVVAALLFLAGATLLGLQLLVGDLTGGDESATAGTDTPAAAEEPVAEESPVGEPQPLAVNVVTDYDPPPGGNGEENPDTAGLALDGDPETVWRTQTYYDPMELQKPGVGLVLDLGEPRTVRSVQLLLEGETSGVEIRVAPEDADVAPEQPDGWAVVAAEEDAGTSVELTLAEPVRTGWVLVWFTRLPAVGEDFRGGIAEVVVLG
jgi:putative peptidoglycan lipid II flippase